jgi:hypothetical protein
LIRTPWRRRGLTAALATAVATVGLTGLAVTPAFAATRLQAENATLENPNCGDGAAEFTHTTATGETVLFMGGEGCTATFNTSSPATANQVRWFAGGINGQVCGTFGITVNGVEVTRTASSCSQSGATPDNFQLATFPSGNSIAAGNFKLVWHPSGATGYDAHVDWIEITPQSSTVRAQAENATLENPNCGDGAAEFTHTTATGETVLFMGGEGCTATFNTSSTASATQVRWFAGGINGQVCGTFGITVNGVEVTRTASSCSQAGATPDNFQLATFPSGNSIAAGNFKLVWHPSGATGYDAHVDWIEYTTGGSPPPPPPPGPPNDNFANAETVSLLPYNPVTSNANATREAGEPQCSGTTATIWYKLPASWTAPITVDTIGSAVDTVVGVYTGSSVGGLSQVACDDNSAGLQSSLEFTMVSGQTYYIQVGSKNGTGSLQIHIAQPAGPANDTFANATTVSLGSVVSQSTFRSSSQVGEPLCHTAGTTVWFKYTHSLSVAREVYANTFGSDPNFDTTLGVYQGSSVTSLTQVGCKDDTRGLRQTVIGWLAQPGQTYYIAAAGFGTATGNLQLNVLEGTLVALGDSVVAGHGLGPDPNGFGHNPSSTYVQQVGDALHLRVANMAMTGACASNATLSTDPNHGTPASCSDRSIMADQINAIPYTATQVVVGVGADDIEFAFCLEKWLNNAPEQNQCQSGNATMASKIAALKVNLGTVLDRVNAMPSKPFVTVMGYYNLFADHATTDDPNTVCDIFYPAAVARDNTLAIYDHSGTSFRAKASDTQHAGYLYGADVVQQLNDAISGVAAAKGATFVNPQATFAGHDMCATIRGGTVSDTYVWGPKFHENWDAILCCDQDYDSRPMPATCQFTVPNRDKVVTTSVHKDFVGTYTVVFDTNCIAHPTQSGANALVGLVQPAVQTTLGG